MNKWFKSEKSVRCMTPLSLFLLLFACILLYESLCLIKEFRSLAAESLSLHTEELSEIRTKNFSEKTEEIILYRRKHFLTSFLLILLGIMVFSLLFSLKDFVRNTEDDSAEKNSGQDLPDENEESGFPDLLLAEPAPDHSDNHVTLPLRQTEESNPSFEKMFDVLQKISEPDRKNHAEGGEEQDDFSEDMDLIEEETGTLAHSYSKMVEALQKINELEKKHSVELANANEMLEKEVTERERAEKEIRYLSRKLISGIEEAQKKLAQDLHDEFGQTLAALHMGVENLWNTMPEQQDRQKENFDHLIDLIEQLGDRIRSISSDLRPDLLDDLGLIPTLEWYIKEFMEQRPDIRVFFQAIGFKKRLSSEFELILYRIFQESLNNVVKHAKAETVNVMLTYSFPKVILMIKDNGTGFDTSVRSGGIGLIGMRERVVSVQGNIDIRSEKGKGTGIRVTLPVSAENQ